MHGHGRSKGPWLLPLLACVCLLLWPSLPPAHSSTLDTPLPSFSDLIIVLPSSDGRHLLIQNSRSWREGIRTFIPTNSSDAEAQRLSQQNEEHLETYLHVDDEVRALHTKPCEHAQLARETASSFVVPCRQKASAPVQDTIIGSSPDGLRAASIVTQKSGNPASNTASMLATSHQTQPIRAQLQRPTSKSSKLLFCNVH